MKILIPAASEFGFDGASAGRYNPKLTAEIREREAAAAAKVIGAESIGLGFHDFGVYDDWETLHKFADVIRQVKPDVVITHGPNDYLFEHIKVGQITIAASYAAGSKWKTP